MYYIHRTYMWVFFRDAEQQLFLKLVGPLVSLNISLDSKCEGIAALTHGLCFKIWLYLR